MITIEAVRKEDIDEAWDWVEPLISVALEYTMGEYDTSHVLERIKEGAIIALIIKDETGAIAVLTLEIVDMPLKRIVNVMTAGGKDMHKWLDMAMEHIDKLAREVGADQISIHGRVGWLRQLAEYNYKHTYTVLTKEL